MRLRGRRSRPNVEHLARIADAWEVESERLSSAVHDVDISVIMSAVIPSDVRSAVHALWCQASFASGYMQGEANVIRKKISTLEEMR